MMTILLKVNNKRRVMVVIAACALSLLSGCHSIQFVQYEQVGDSPTISRWHHATFNGMIELSRPLNLESVCGEKAWTRITTEFTFYNALATSLVPASSFFGVSRYSAWTNKVKCYDPSLTES